jgi:hypothetical protein
LTVNEETSPEDLTILAALATLESLDETPGGTPDARPAHVSDTSEMLARLYREVLGLLPLELEPIAPAPAVKARMMAKIRGDETQPAGAVEPALAPAPSTAVPPAPARPAPPPAPVVAPRAPVASPAPVVVQAGASPSAPTPPLPRTAPTPPIPPLPQMPAPSQAAVPPQPAVPRTPTQEMPFWRPTSARSASAPRRPNRWPLALAASLAFLALGVAGWMFYEMQRGQQTIASLRQQLEAERTPARVGDALDNREKLGLVTSPSVLVAALRPDGQAPSQPYAHGMLFVAADHQHWYLALQGLRPAGSGQAYKLWFVADQGMVDAGSFTIDPKLPIELSSKQMPAGTKAAIITLENDPRAPAPTGPPVLRAGPMSPITPITT